MLIPRRVALAVHPEREAWRAWVLPVAILAYLTLPRLAVWAAGGVPGPLFPSGALNLTAHYAVALTGLALLGAAGLPRIGRGLGLLWLHASFLLRAVEAGLLAETGVGFSPLALHHLDADAVALALRREWPEALGALAVLVVAHRLLGWLWPMAWPRPWRADAHAGRARAWATFAAVALLALASVNSARILVQEARRLARGPFPAVSLAVAAREYWGPAGPDARFRLDAAERQLARGWGIDLDAATPRIVASAGTPPHLLLVYLEGWQAALGEPIPPEAGLPPDLTPNISGFAARHTRATAFYGTVTPTIAGLAASQCGLPVAVGNRSFQRDRGLLRNLTCLGDLLRAAGYRQEFLGGASAAFSGKDAFLRAHGYDRVWGWADWEERPEYAVRRNEWGLHDTDLVREALARLRELAKSGPVHLTLLTLSTHPPGYPAPDCPVYRKGARWLNAIHCTDHAVGLLLDGLAESSLARRTAVVLVGDHTLFPLPATRAALPPEVPLDWYGPLFLAWSVPGERRAWEGATPGHLPDLAPTVLGVLGLEVRGRFPAARSLLAPPVPRRLVGPRAEVVDGRVVGEPPGDPLRCSRAQAAAAVLEPTTGPLSRCQRRRLAEALQFWLLERPLR